MCKSYGNINHRSHKGLIVILQLAKLNAFFRERGFFKVRQKNPFQPFPAKIISKKTNDSNLYSLLFVQKNHDSVPSKP